MTDRSRPIVIFEDAHTKQRNLKGTLEKDGFSVVSIERAPDMLAKAAAAKPAIIITDFDADKAHPLKIIEALKANAAFKETEIFIYSDSIDVKQEVALRKLKISSWFIKSEKSADLIGGVRTHFSWDEMSKEYDPFAGMEEEERREQALDEDGNPVGEEFHAAPRTDAPRASSELVEVIEVTKPKSLEDSESFKEMFSDFQAGIEKKLEGDANSAESFYNLGVSYLGMGMDQQALEQFEKIARDQDWKQRATQMIGVTCRKLGDYNRAIESFKACYQSTADEYAKLDFRYEIADTLMTMGKLKEAYQMFATVFKADKDFKDTKAKLIQIKTTLESKSQA